MEAIATKIDMSRYTVRSTKHEHQFQEICEGLEPVYGKVIWTLPHLPGVTEYKLEEAAKIAAKRGKQSIAYLKGIIKKLP